MGRSDTQLGAWLRGLLSRSHPNTVVVALAAKMARIVWALLLLHQRTCDAVDAKLTAARKAGRVSAADAARMKKKLEWVHMDSAR